MVDSGRSPSLSPASENSSSEHSPGSFATLSGGSSAVGDASKAHMSSLSDKKTKSSPPPSPSPTQPPPPSSNEPPQQDLITPCKRPRGRPPGSKNKPKPPIIIKEDTDHLLKPIIIEIPAGNDIVESVIGFARRRHVGISILSGCGTVSDVTLRHPVSRAPAFPLRGPFNLISLTGTYISGRFPPLLLSSSSSSSNPSSSNPSWPACNSFGICLSGSQGHVFGGVVGGKVMATSLVIVMASVFKKPEYHRVPYINIANVDETEEDNLNNPFAAVINADAAAADAIPMPNNISPFSTVANSNPLNIQVPSASASAPPPADVNVNLMHWNHSSHTDNY